MLNEERYEINQWYDYLPQGYFDKYPLAKLHKMMEPFIFLAVGLIMMPIND